MPNGIVCRIIVNGLCASAGADNVVVLSPADDVDNGLDGRWPLAFMISTKVAATRHQCLLCDINMKANVRTNNDDDNDDHNNDDDVLANSCQKFDLFVYGHAHHRP